VQKTLEKELYYQTEISVIQIFNTNTQKSRRKKCSKSREGSHFITASPHHINDMGWKGLAGPFNQI